MGPGVIRVARVQGVDLHAHWSTLALAALLLITGAGTVQGFLVSVAGVGAYLGVLLVHEWGHVIAARRRGCAVAGVALYPLWGYTRFSAPRSSFDACLIAWGGVAAQVAVAVPMVAWLIAFGATGSAPANAVLGIMGYLSLLIAAFNLLPVRPLDGATAWRIVPLLLARRTSPRPATRPRSLGPRTH